ncbi:MAG: hypothetical protein WAL27_02425, partial [Cellulosimicrobium cellulans]
MTEHKPVTVALGRGRLPMPVLLGSVDAELARWGSLLDSVAAAAGDVPALLAVAGNVGSDWPKPGDGQ